MHRITFISMYRILFFTLICYFSEITYASGVEKQDSSRLSSNDFIEYEAVVGSFHQEIIFNFKLGYALTFPLAPSVGIKAGVGVGWFQLTAYPKYDLHGDVSFYIKDKSDNGLFCGLSLHWVDGGKISYLKTIYFTDSFERLIRGHFGVTINRSFSVRILNSLTQNAVRKDTWVRPFFGGISYRWEL